MKKNDYKKPTMRVVKIQQRLHLLAGSSGGDTPGGGGGTARGYRGGWDDSNE
jgi:hypothetical protein